MDENGGHRGRGCDFHDFYGYKLSRTNSHQAVKQDK